MSRPSLATLTQLPPEPAAYVEARPAPTNPTPVAAAQADSAARRKALRSSFHAPRGVVAVSFISSLRNPNGSVLTPPRSKPAATPGPGPTTRAVIRPTARPTTTPLAIAGSGPVPAEPLARRV